MFLFSKIPDRFWGPPSVLFNWFHGFFFTGRRASGLWSWPTDLYLALWLRMSGTVPTLRSPTCLCGVHRRTFTFLPSDRFATDLYHAFHLYRKKIKGLDKNYINRDLRFSQRCYWRFMIFGCQLLNIYRCFEETAHLRNVWATHQTTRHHVPEGLNLHPHDYPRDRKKCSKQYSLGGGVNLNTIYT
jgi:hypothetical protein